MFPERLKTITRTGVAVALAVGCALVVSLSAQAIPRTPWGDPDCRWPGLPEWPMSPGW